MKVFGNVAPAGALVTRAADADPRWLRGPARVFESVDALQPARCGDVFVIRLGEDAELDLGALPGSLAPGVAVITDARVRGDSAALVLSEVRPADLRPLKAGDVVTIDLTRERVDSDSLVGTGEAAKKVARGPRSMELHVALPSGAIDLATTRKIAQRAESAGFTALWTHDHVLPPASLVSHHHSYEPLMLLAHLAEHTQTLRLGTSILVLPMRNPFVVAKQVATLDLICDGRLNLGLGAGYSVAEFENVHASFPDRGRRLGEAVDLLRHLFSGTREPFAGDYYSYRDGVFEPRPLQGTLLPIMIGGHSTAALRRAAAKGDIWQSSGLDPARFADAVATLEQLAGDARPIVGARTQIPADLTDAEIRERLLAWHRAGAEQLVVNVGDRFESVLERVAEAHRTVTYES